MSGNIFRQALLAALSLFAFCAQAQPVLPPPIADWLSHGQVAPDNVALLIKEAGAPAALIAYNVDRPMNPASVMKVITTYAGLELLGPGYTWKTEVLTTGELRGSTLYGDLILKGGGDPKLTAERLAQLARRLRERGLTTLHGDLVLDKSFFEVAPFDPAKFDGEPLRAYNVGADALLANFKTVRFQFAPSLDGKSVTINPEPRLSQLEIVNHVRLSNGSCGDLRDHITLDVQTPSEAQLRVAFTGSYGRECGEQGWNIALLDHSRFLGGMFASLWKEVGGSWAGAVRVASAPADARLIATLESANLADTVRDINKFSNNVMARQLFLTLSAEPGKAGSVERSTALIREWLQKKGIAAPELVLENGAGLSRVERISAGSLGAVLDSVWKSSVMPEFMSSLSLVGVDGTLRKRGRGDSVAGQAHLKTGTLNDSRCLAGYVLDVYGRRWIVVMMVNQGAGAVQTAQDGLLAWIQRGPILAKPQEPAPALAPPPVPVPAPPAAEGARDVRPEH